MRKGSIKWKLLKTNSFQCPKYNQFHFHGELQISIFILLAQESIATTYECKANVYGLEISEKYLFEMREAHNTNKMVVNESAKKTLYNQLGDKIKMEYFEQEFTVAGIVKDFNLESFHKPVAPV